MITMRPYIKNVVNEVKFTYVAEEYKLPKTTKTEKKKVEKSNEVELEEFKENHDNTISLNSQTAINLFDDLSLLKNKNKQHYF